jgi:flagellar hook protein FlgE
MDVASNNLANASTLGFQRSTANFADVFSNDPASNPKTAVGSGVVTSAVSRDTTAGSLQTTGRVTDMAINGRGYFLVRDPSATGNNFSFTRAGSFGLNANGFIADPAGNQLIGYQSRNTGTFDANGNAIMAPNTTAAPMALQVTPQFDNGATLPDGTIAGQETQIISISGPATATGKIDVGGVAVSISNGDTAAQIANKVQSALSSDPAFVHRQVSVVGTATDPKVQVVFAASEGGVSALMVDTPTAISPSVSTKTAFSATPEVQNVRQTGSLVGNDTYTLSIPVIGSTTPLSVPVTVPSTTQTDLVAAINTAIANAANGAGVAAVNIPVVKEGADTSSLDFSYANGQSVTGSVTFTDGANNTGATFAASTVSSIGQTTPKVEQIAIEAATSDATVNVAGVPVSVSAGDSAATVANKIQTALQTAFPLRTITVDANYNVDMAFTAAEGDGAIVQPQYTNKAPTKGSSSVTVQGSLAPVLMQGVSISAKGEVMGTYSNGATYTMGFIALANFPSDAGLKDVGGNLYAQTGASGSATVTPAGAPSAGNIMSGQLEQSNVNITTELMGVITAQQIYNGNAKAIQTMMDAVTKITELR